MTDERKIVSAAPLHFPKTGAKVVFRTDGGLGVLDPESSRPAFHPTVRIADGDEGIYLGPTPDTGEDWHIATIERDGVEYRAPVHRSMFEVVTDEE